MLRSLCPPVSPPLLLVGFKHSHSFHSSLLALAKVSLFQILWLTQEVGAPLAPTTPLRKQSEEKLCNDIL